MLVPFRTLLRIPLSTSLCSWFEIACGFILTVCASVVTDRPGRLTNACNRRKRVAFARTLKVRSSPSACPGEISGRAASRGLGRLPKAAFAVMALTYTNVHLKAAETGHDLAQQVEPLASKIGGQC
jgi:hypothetical protein